MTLTEHINPLALQLTSFFHLTAGNINASKKVMQNSINAKRIIYRCQGIQD